MIQGVDRPIDIRTGTAAAVTVSAKFCSGEHKMINTFVVSSLKTC
jgi:hypothetical protein